MYLCKYLNAYTWVCSFSTIQWKYIYSTLSLYSIIYHHNLRGCIYLKMPQKYLVEVIEQQHSSWNIRLQAFFILWALTKLNGQQSSCTYLDIGNIWCRGLDPIPPFKQNLTSSIQSEHKREISEHNICTRSDHGSGSAQIHHLIALFMEFLQLHANIDIFSSRKCDEWTRRQKWFR